MTEVPKPMRCPNDDGDLHQVATRTRQGVSLLLDQCEGCGGVWFDRFELFQMDEREAAAVERVDEKALRLPRGSHDDPLCPRCARPLSSFRDPVIPENIQMMICPSCEGLWLNHGMLLGYANFRQGQHPSPDPALAAKYEKMLAATSEADKWDSMAKVGHKFGGSRDPLTMLPLDGTPDQLAKIDMAQAAAFTIVRALARLVFGI